MQILGNRILVSKIEEEKKTGFELVAATDSFLYKGKVEEVGTGTFQMMPGEIVLFAKYSPDTQEVTVDGKTMKIISVSDVLAVI